jgi:hypothetical protein
MPNNYAFDETASDLKTQIYGFNETGGILPLLTDTDGNLQIGGTVVVSQGTVTILGGTITIAGGSVQVSSASVTIAGVAATASFVVFTAAAATATLVMDTSQQKTYSYYVYNTSADTATVQLEVSPTTTNEFFAPDGTFTLVPPTGGKAVLCTKRYLDFTRISVQTTGGTVSVYYNAQV